tara:strand:- start:67 stop:456 length:390 start_codon:yes stop_codon:yes gene_type:complete
VKTLLALLLLIPSLSWGFFGKKYDCSFDKSYYKNGGFDYIEGNLKFKLEITMFEKKMIFHMSDGDIIEYSIDKKNDAILISKKRNHESGHESVIEFDKIVTKISGTDIFKGKVDYFSLAIDYDTFYCEK